MRPLSQKLTVLPERTAIVRGLEPGTDYTLTAGDAEKGLFGAPVAFTVTADGKRSVGGAPETGFFEALIAAYQTLFGVAVSLKTIVGLLT